jgi:DNA primase
VIPQSFIQDLLARVDVVDVVGRHVKLKKAGANYLGLCPFHGEKSPSFTVSPTKQFYHCFGCGAHGSAVGFLMEHGGLSYVDAIHELAQSVGLQVPREASPNEEASRRDPGLYDLMALAARFYRQRLKDSPRAIDYLKGRGLAGETAARFAIGYAPEGWRSLQAAVPDYSVASLVECGLVIESGDEPATRKRYDRFRDRIMFPIRNPRGQVIGFGGRVIDNGEPKYLNSPETPLFAKGRELYGLFEAREALRSANSVIVVEGYMDVVMLAQHGVGNAVATLGTATTADHVRKLLRIVDRVVFSFDGDTAGRKAAWRALEACLPHAADTKRLEFLFLPPEHDPDSYVRAHGLEGFDALLKTALPLSEYMIQALSARVDLSEPEGRAQFLALARPLLQAMPMAALRLQLMHRVAEVGEVAPAELERFVAEARADDRRDEGAWSSRGEFSGSGAGFERREGGRFGSREGGQARGRFGGRPGDGGRFAGDRFAAPGGRDASGGFGVRARAAPPDLARRVRLLSALHPALALDDFDPSFVPSDLMAWIASLRAQPPGSSLASICESLRDSQPEVVAQLQRDAGADRTMVAEMTLEEARAEFAGALEQLRARSIREELDAIVARGVSDDADRARYQTLLSLRTRA